MLFPDKCPSLPQRHLIPACKHGKSATCSPPHVRFRKRQDCQDSRDSLGTALCETVATVSHSAPPTVACSEQLAHFRFRTAGTATCFQLTTLALTPADIATGTGTAVACQKTPTPTKLQIPATVTTLILITPWRLQSWTFVTSLTTLHGVSYADNFKLPGNCINPLGLMFHAPINR